MFKIKSVISTVAYRQPGVWLARRSLSLRQRFS